MERPPEELAPHHHQEQAEQEPSGQELGLQRVSGTRRRGPLRQTAVRLPTEPHRRADDLRRSGSQLVVNVQERPEGADRAPDPGRQHHPEQRLHGNAGLIGEPEPLELVRHRMAAVGAVEAGKDGERGHRPHIQAADPLHLDDDLVRTGVVQVGSGRVELRAHPVH